MEDELALPWKQLFLIYLCRLIEPISYTIHLPFIYFMIKNFNMTTEENIGYYCGLVGSVSGMSLFISGIPLGSLSDRVGRKPVVFMGLMSITLSLLLFGLGKSFAWIITVKLVSGLMDGNAGVLKSMVAEVTRDHSPQKKTQAFLFFHITYNFGMVIGTALGGYLSEPITKFPNFFKEGTRITYFLKEFPYFLPCFIAFIISITVTTLCLFKLKETLPKKSCKNQSEETPLLQQHKNSVGSSGFTILNKKHSIGEILTPKILLICAVYCLPVFELDYLRVFFPIWASTPVDKGGLGFKTNEVGTLLSYSTMIITVTQVFLLDRLTRRWSMTRIIQCCLFTTLVTSFIIGLFRVPSLLLNGQTLEIWFGLLVSMSIQSLGQSMTILLCVILLNNAVVYADTLGFVNAFAQCSGSVARMLSPVITGLIWSSTIKITWIPLDLRSYINWAILGVFGVFTFFLSTRLDYSHHMKTHR